MNKLDFGEWKLMTIYCQTVNCESYNSVLRPNIELLKSQNVEAMNVISDHRKH